MTRAITIFGPVAAYRIPTARRKIGVSSFFDAILRQDYVYRQAREEVEKRTDADFPEQRRHFGP
jgi:hypothetical protein